MSQQTRQKLTRMTVCDLCDEEIPEGTHPMDTASLSHGYIANRVTERTKRVWFRWPDLNRSGMSRTREDEKRAREMRVEWDFHAQCALDALRAAIDAKATNRENGSER
ncbi:MAG TPA: hypothetical protein VKY39_02055 [Aggregatilineales bacterium]|nr:hypothetical protein [Aggregatilineales bacterium]